MLEIFFLSLLFERLKIRTQIADRNNANRQLTKMPVIRKPSSVKV